MVDAARAYRRWMLKRFAVLLPGFLLTLGLALFAGQDGNSALWLRIPRVAVPLGLACLFAYLAVQTVRILRHARSGRRQVARGLKRELRPYRALSLGAMAILLSVGVAPSAFMDREGSAPAASPATSVRKPRPAVDRGLPVMARIESLARMGLLGELQAEEARPQESAAGSGEPQGRLSSREPSLPEIKPIILEVPPEILFDDFNMEKALVFQEAPAGSRELTPAEAEELHQFPRVETSPDELEARWSDLLPTLIDRLGLLDERNTIDAQPAEVRLDFMMGTTGGHWESQLGELGVEFPISREDLFRAVGTINHLVRDGGSGGSDIPLEWESLTLDYVRRLVGYTRHAPFDLAISVGMNADYLDSQAEGPSFARGLGFAAHAGLESAVWYAGTYGFIVRGGQSIDFDMTNMLVRITDFTAVIRVDLNETVSFHAGYRALWFHFHDRADPAASDARGWIAGPVVGVDFRF